MKWTRMPDESGWWFFTRDLVDWDLAKPFPVQKHDYGPDRVEFTSQKKPGEKWIKVESYEGWWYGPFRVRRPDELLQES